MVVRRHGLGALLIVILGLTVYPPLVRAQSVELLYEEGGMFGGPKYVTIAHSDAEGTVPPDTNVVRTADQLYFAFRPKGDWSFESEDRQKLRQITLTHADTSKTLSPRTVSLIKEKEESRTAVLGVSKSGVDWLTPVRFRHKVDTSKALSLKEYYAPGYKPLRQAYEEGRRLLREEKPLRAMQALRPFNDEQPPFSLVDKASAVLDTASTRVLDRTRSRFRSLRSELVSEPSAEGLTRLDSFRVQIDSIWTTLAPYSETQPPTDVQARLDNLTRSADRLYSDARGTYRRETLWIFLRGKYDNPKLRLYLDALTQMLVDAESALDVAEMRVDSLRSSLLDTPRFAEERRQLRAEGWESEFRRIVDLVNENIRERNEVFGDDIMQSLRLRRPAAPQPYYEIAAAMNAILAGDRTRFSEAWGRALEKITALELLNDLQRWRLASQLSPDAVPPRARKLTREARSYWRAGDLSAAEGAFQLAARLAQGYAPLQYELGRVKQARGDTLAARKNFRKARDRAASYTPPAVSELRILLDQKKYQQALGRSDSLIKKEAYWLVYMPKVRALVGMGRYEDAQQVLRSRCEPLNDKSYALYTLFAETYAGLGAWKYVRWAVQQTDSLSPRRSTFVRRMSDVRTAAKQEGVSLRAESDSTGAGGEAASADPTGGTER